MSSRSEKLEKEKKGPKSNDGEYTSHRRTSMDAVENRQRQARKALLVSTSTRSTTHTTDVSSSGGQSSGQEED